MHGVRVPGFAIQTRGFETTPGGRAAFGESPLDLARDKPGGIMGDANGAPVQKLLFTLAESEGRGAVEGGLVV